MKSGLKSVLATSFYFLLVLVLVFLVVTYVCQRIEVVGTSMSPTLEDNDHLLVDKITYRFKDPQRFDIVVFPFKYEPDTHYIKRVIGLPGERVYIDTEGKIYINGAVLEEGYGNDTITDPGRAYEEIKLGENEYFVLGDNRNNSQDSRDPVVGNIARSEIIGRAFMRVFPLKNLGIIKHQ